MKTQRNDLTMNNHLNQQLFRQLFEVQLELERYQNDCRACKKNDVELIIWAINDFFEKVIDSDDLQ